MISNRILSIDFRFRTDKSDAQKILLARERRRQKKAKILREEKTGTWRRKKIYATDAPPPSKEKNNLPGSLGTWLTSTKQGRIHDSISRVRWAGAVTEVRTPFG